MKPGSVIIAHLTNPNEKYWGVLESLSNPGLVVRGIHLSSFDDWVNSIAHSDEPALGLATIFFPMARIERIFLDEPVGEVESLSQSFERRTGLPLDGHLSATNDGPPEK